MCSNGSFSRLPWQREPKVNQKQKKMVIFVIFVILKCDLPPNQHTSGYQYGYQNLPCSFFDQFMLILYD